MKLTVSVRLLPSPEQAEILRTTLARCNSACDWLAARAREAGVCRPYDLHKVAYRDLRSRFGIGSQAAVMCIAKVAEAIKSRHGDGKCNFRRYAAQPFDERIYRFLPEKDCISIWTLVGRMRVPFACGKQQRPLLSRVKGQVDLMFVRGKWMLAATYEAETAPTFEPTDVLGVDLGLVNLAVDSRGNSYSGARIEATRRRQHNRRRALHKIGTRSAKRAVKRTAGRQSRFQRHTNHCIAKAIVAIAERDRCAIALEDLSGIRDRAQATRRQRARLHNWGFAEERALITYKAALRGVPVLVVDPRNTSRQCPCCSLIDKRNRPNRDTFRCIECGFVGPADAVAATNIRQRGLVARGMVATPQVAAAIVAGHKENRQL